MPHRPRHHRPLPVRNVRNPGRGIVSPEYCQLWRGRPVRVVGRPIRAEVERALNEENIDHVWFTLEVPEAGDVLVAINTLSLCNLRAGFDGRVRVGMVRGEYRRQPRPGMFPARLLNYESIGNHANIFYETHERLALEGLLLEKAGRANLIQAWGIAFCNRFLGVHQIHSRRASCAVPVNLTGMDGGIRFYYDDGMAELLLFKFCGQD